MSLCKFNIAVVALGLINLFFGGGEPAAFIFTTMAQITLLVVMWFALKRVPIARNHNEYIKGIELNLHAGKNAAAIKKVLEDEGMTAPGHAGLAARQLSLLMMKNQFNLH